MNIMNLEIQFSSDGDFSNAPSKKLSDLIFLTAMINPANLLLIAPETRSKRSGRFSKL